MDQFYTKKILGKNSIEFSITIPSASFEQSFNLLLKEYSKDTDVKGFRKGKVPEDMISNEVRQTIRLETFQRLSSMYINTALTKESVVPVAPIQYNDLPKLLDNIDVTFSITVTVMPEFKLGNLKSIKIKPEEAKVDEKDIQRTLDELKKNEKIESKEMNDDWAKEVAKMSKLDGINSLDDLKKKIEEILKEQKEHVILHKTQDEAFKKGIEISKIEIPKEAIDFEAGEREKSFMEEMKNRNVNVDDFLKSNNITIEKMRELWIQDAKDALEADTFLNVYSKERDINVSEDDLNKKIDEILKEQSDKSLSSNQEWREYIRRVLLKEKSFNSFIKEVLGDKFLDEH